MIHQPHQLGQKRNVLTINGLWEPGAIVALPVVTDHIHDHARQPGSRSDPRPHLRVTAIGLPLLVRHFTFGHQHAFRQTCLTDMREQGSQGKLVQYVRIQPQLPPQQEPPDADIEGAPVGVIVTTLNAAQPQQRIRVTGHTLRHGPGNGRDLIHIHLVTALGQGFTHPIQGILNISQNRLNVPDLLAQRAG